MCELYWLLLLPPSMLETLFAAWRTGSAALFSLSGWTTPLPCMDSTIMLKLQNYLAEPSKLPCQALKTTSLCWHVSHFGYKVCCGSARVCCAMAVLLDLKAVDAVKTLPGVIMHTLQLAHRHVPEPLHLMHVVW